MTTGIVVLVAAVVLAAVVGVLRKRSDGTFRGPRSGPVRADGGGASGGAGRPEDVTEVPVPTGNEPSESLSAAELGQERLGERATLVQFSSAFCAPCRASRVTLAEVASRVDGVAHVEVDAESQLDLVRRLNILRTPTTLVLDPEGRVRTRAAGAPRRADVYAALDRVVV